MRPPPLQQWRRRFAIASLRRVTSALPFVDARVVVAADTHGSRTHDDSHADRSQACVCATLHTRRPPALLLRPVDERFDGRVPQATFSSAPIAPRIPRGSPALPCKVGDETTHSNRRTSPTVLPQAETAPSFLVEQLCSFRVRTGVNPASVVGFDSSLTPPPTPPLSIGATLQDPSNCARPSSDEHPPRLTSPTLAAGLKHTRRDVESQRCRIGRSLSLPPLPGYTSIYKILSRGEVGT